MNPIKAIGIAIGGVVVGIIVVVMGIIAIFLFAILGALIGAITGFILSHTPILGDMVRQGFTSVLEVENPDLVSIGAMLGFIAGFFKNWNSGGHECHTKEEKDDECCTEDWDKNIDIPEVHIDVKPTKKKKKK
jgi:hypothetical protein